MAAGPNLREMTGVPDHGLPLWPRISAHSFRASPLSNRPWNTSSPLVHPGPIPQSLDTSRMQPLGLVRPLAPRSLWRSRSHDPVWLGRSTLATRVECERGRTMLRPSEKGRTRSGLGANLSVSLYTLQAQLWEGFGERAPTAPAEEGPGICLAKQNPEWLWSSRASVRKSLARLGTWGTRPRIRWPVPRLQRARGVGVRPRGRGRRRRGRWATYGDPGPGTGGPRPRAASAAPASGSPRGAPWLTPHGAWRSRSEVAGARRGSGVSTAPSCRRPWEQQEWQETRQPRSSLRPLQAPAPLICARPLCRLATVPKPRAAPGPRPDCNLSPHPRSPHLPGPDPPLPLPLR